MNFSALIFFAQFLFALPFFIMAIILLGFLVYEALELESKISDYIEKKISKKKELLDRHESWDEFWKSLYILPYGKDEKEHKSNSVIKRCITCLWKKIKKEFLDLMPIIIVMLVICWPLSAICMIAHLV